MKISLNGLELSRTADGDQNVGQVLNEVQSEIRLSGRVVTRIVVDGTPLPEGWQRRQKLAQPVSRTQRLDLTVEEPEALKLQTLQDVGELAGQLMQRARPLGVKFRIGDEVTANNELASFLEDLKLALSGLDFSTRHMPAGGTAPIRSRVVESANGLLPSLDRLYKAQAGGDYIAVADELEYDIREQIAVWPNLTAEALESLKTPEQAR